ncbi:MAG TPA: GNAT family N-acetyltransferase [Thermoplasmata archaeon]|nr:GNAT family N-acetyltransferase [Thermoplasmata archaeon]
MPPEAVELRPTIDRAWLESAAAADPITHAYALWDLDRLPSQVRFVSALRDGKTLGYLLTWQSPGRPPTVHWVAPPLPEIASALPPRPFIFVGPEEVRPLIHRIRGPCVDLTVLVEAAPLGATPGPSALDARVRRLTREHMEELGELVRSSNDPLVQGYAGLDPGPEVVFGVFEGRQIVAIASASVRRSSVWFISGVFVRPAHRGRGWGGAVVRAVMAEAARAGAPCALFVREDRADARAVYDGLGFHPVARRAWLDCGTGRTI